MRGWIANDRHNVIPAGFNREAERLAIDTVTN
jgi:hypothetical protein